MNWFNFFSTTGSSYGLIFAAEIGDKSQLVCMALAARYRAWPVMTGSMLAFIILNSLAVIFGVAIASMIPNVILTALVALLFLIFGIHALRIENSTDDENVEIRTNNNIILATLLLIIVAEFGDKTQLAVVALSSTHSPMAVWTGSTLALITTSALGVWAGRTLLQRIPIVLLHRISGVFFILLALFAAYASYSFL